MSFGRTGSQAWRAACGRGRWRLWFSRTYEGNRSSSIPGGLVGCVRMTTWGMPRLNSKPWYGTETLSATTDCRRRSKIISREVSETASPPVSALAVNGFLFGKRKGCWSRATGRQLITPILPFSFPLWRGQTIWAAEGKPRNALKGPKKQKTAAASLFFPPEWKRHQALLQPRSSGRRVTPLLS